jgi:DNA-3-methyladenine glycosylase I
LWERGVARRRPALPPKRCSWPSTELDIEYHDREWGVPVHDDRLFFEMLTLEGAQAGLSWSTILKKRDGYRKAFANFDPARVARFTEKDVDRLVADPSIVRHRQKVESTVSNARAFLEIQKSFGSFDAYVWQFVGGKQKVNSRRSLRDVPPRSAESDALSKDLLARGFKFVGSTICYAFMQATGMVDDHVIECFRHGVGSRNK